MDVNREVRTDTSIDGALSGNNAAAAVINAQLKWGSDGDGGVNAKAYKEASGDTPSATASKSKTNDDDDDVYVKAAIVHGHV